MKNRSRSISIVVADDHPVVLHGLADVLRSNPDIASQQPNNFGSPGDRLSR
jgi:hypothetical protein